MRGKSHRCLGKYLVQHYMSDTPERYVKAFLLGCIEPDRNPATYLKGSIRCQWLRGHNYRNARRFMRAISARLEKKEKLGLFDYYTLGKLIHYTTDAFTYAHNDTFPTAMHIAAVYAIEDRAIPAVDALVETFLRLEAENGDLLFLVASDKPQVVFDTLGALRCECARELGLLKKDDYQFLWVTQFRKKLFCMQQCIFLCKFRYV